jgi:hypothetical protein
MPTGTFGTTELPVNGLVDAYLTALEAVVNAGYGPEIDEQEQRRLDRVTESDFLRETAWVILNAGMRERVVRNLFPSLSDAFLDWRSADAILAHRSHCSRRALGLFAHRPKIEAILQVVERVHILSFERVLSSIETSGVSALEIFAYIGPVTKFHLAKNLGLDVAKPDRHLLRLSHAAGFVDPGRLCSIVADVTGDRVGTVDLVLWRYATMNPNYELLFRPAKERRRSGCGPRRSGS